MDTANRVRAKMEELKDKFPEGVEYRIEYDTTVFVKESITSVYHTLIEAFVLVFIVVLVFLQNWRATIIPMVAVPVSLIGTLACMSCSASRSTTSRCSAWCWRSASWSTTRSWWWRMSSD